MGMGEGRKRVCNGWVAVAGKGLGGASSFGTSVVGREDSGAGGGGEMLRGGVLMVCR
jgi:hypothetical protein